MKLKLLLCAALAFFAFGASAQAQTPVVVQCSVNNPTNPWAPCSSGNPLPVSASVTASIAPFLPSASGSRGTQFTVNTTTTSQTLPTGAAVVVSNEGTTNTMYCNAVGASATTADQPISPNGGWFVFGTANAGGSINCIASGGTTTANMVGGSGLPAGTGGGSGGGGGGTVNQGTGGASAWLVTGTVTANAGTNLNTSALATSANQTNKTQFTQLTDGTNAATTYTAYGTAPSGNVPGANVYVTNATTNQSNASSGVATGSGNSPTIGYLYGFNGTTWDQLQDDANKSLKVAPQATPAGGASNYGPLYSAVSNNATNVKASAGTLYSITVTQSTTTALELKLYNLSTSPTCSSATGIVDNIPIPSNATSPGYHLTYPVGRAFSTGIGFCLVAFGNPAASTDNGNAVTGATVSMTYE